MGNFKNRIVKAFKTDNLMSPKKDERGNTIKVKSIVQPADDDPAEDIRFDCEDCD